MSYQKDLMKCQHARLIQITLFNMTYGKSSLLKTISFIFTIHLHKLFYPCFKVMLDVARKSFYGKSLIMGGEGMGVLLKFIMNNKMDKS